MNKQAQRKSTAAVALFAKSMESVNLTGRSTTKKIKKSTVPMGKDDWVRVKLGELTGAEGKVVSLKKVSAKVTIVTIRQLNGNEIKLPRPHFEFAAYAKPQDLDR